MAEVRIYAKGGVYTVTNGHDAFVCGDVEVAETAKFHMENGLRPTAIKERIIDAAIQS